MLAKKHDLRKYKIMITLWKKSFLHETYFLKLICGEHLTVHIMKSFRPFWSQNNWKIYLWSGYIKWSYNRLLVFVVMPAPLWEKYTFPFKYFGKNYCIATLKYKFSWISMIHFVLTKWWCMHFTWKERYADISARPIE